VFNESKVSRTHLCRIKSLKTYTITLISTDFGDMAVSVAAVFQLMENDHWIL
jgi:hypothetical protein